MRPGFVEAIGRTGQTDRADGAALNVEHGHGHRQAVGGDVLAHQCVAARAGQVPACLHVLLPLLGIGRAAARGALVEQSALAHRVQMRRDRMAQGAVLQRQQRAGRGRHRRLPACLFAGHHHHLVLIQGRQQRGFFLAVAQAGQLVLGGQAQVKVAPDLVGQLQQAKTKLEGLVEGVVAQQAFARQSRQGAVQRGLGQARLPEQLGEGHGRAIFGDDVEQVHRLLQHAHPGRAGLGGLCARRQGAVGHARLDRVLCSHGRRY